MSVEDEHKLFVAGLAETTTEEGLRKLFDSTGGSVAEVTVPRDRASGKARGFAFVTMSSEDEARQARQHLDGMDYEGRAISVRPFRADRNAPGMRPPHPRDAGTQSYPPPRAAGPGPARPEFVREPPGLGHGPAPQRASQPPGGSEDSTLYIGNLPFDCTSAELEQTLQERGFDGVRRVHMPMDPEGRPRGFGFVSMSSADEARRAVDELQDVMVRGRRLSISVARARGNAGPPPPRAPRPGGFAGGPPPSAGGGYPPAHPAPRFSEPPAFAPEGGGFAESGAGPTEEARRAARWDGAKDKEPEKKKEKKKKGVKAAPAAGTKRRRDDGFRSTRAQDYVDDWDDD
jgi:nucleolin